MAISQRLDLRQNQSLVMTPQLQQAIKLLQLSNAELTEFVEEELNQNPMLERDEGDAPIRGDSEQEIMANSTEAVTSDDEFSGPDSLDLTAGDNIPDSAEKPLDLDYENVWDDAHPRDVSDEVIGGFENVAPIAAGGRSDYSEGLGDFEATLSDEPTLREHLLEQLTLDILEGGDRIIGLHLIDMLDDSGWLGGTTNEVAVQLGCDEDRVKSVLCRLQEFDPPGVFARSLKECLTLQLQDKGRLGSAMELLVDNLELLGNRDKAGLLKICGVDEQELMAMVAEIRALDPKPASSYREEAVQSVTPDILMQPHPDGGWNLELNQETLPRVLVNNQYYALISKGVRRKEEKEYVNERFQTANWLVKSLHQRATTILRVGSEIVKQQDLFFRHGVEHLKPLILRDIAEAIEIHESTVSRVTTNKFMATPRGLYELKYFFTSAIQSVSGGEAHSAEAVRFRIKMLIDGESPKSILSDDKIVDILKQDGVDIARRTVAKYRESMRIGSSVERRRIKAGTF
ncbi:MAG: RNA polymerase factor sigma-54 [Pseudomonadota bacterium]|nr:RNA polymerase factor sigma-54 [Pseudomonadota bacterium]